MIDIRRFEYQSPEPPDDESEKSREARHAILNIIQHGAFHLGSLAFPLEDGEEPEREDKLKFREFIGLANSVVDATEYDLEQLLFWFGYCLIDLGYEQEQFQPLLEKLGEALGEPAFEEGEDES